MKYLFYTFALLLTSYSLDAQKLVTGDLQRVMNGGGFTIGQIASYNVVEGPATGIAGTKSEQYARFDQWRKSASEDELLKMTDHANGVVRAYAFWALIKADSDLSREVWRNHLDDDEMIHTTFGCIVEQMTVHDFMDRLMKGSMF